MPKHYKVEFVVEADPDDIQPEDIADFFSDNILDSYSQVLVGEVAVYEVAHFE